MVQQTHYGIDKGKTWGGDHKQLASVAGALIPRSAGDQNEVELGKECVTPYQDPLAQLPLSFLLL